MISNLSINNQSNISFSARNYYIKPCHKILDSIGEITLDSYQKASLLKKTAIRMLTPERINELAKANCDLAEKTINKLDKLYGGNNYTIIMLGRSLATMGEAIREMGRDVKIIPLSGLRRCYSNNVDNLDIYKSFLDSIGLSREIIQNNPKRKYILMDYAFTGASLENGKEFLESEALLGKCENLIPVEINSLNVFDNTLRKLFVYSRFKNFSPVGKLPFDNLKDTFVQADYSNVCSFNITKYLRKIFLFNMFDALKRNNYKNYVPSNEITALKRQTTQTAIINKLKKN